LPANLVVLVDLWEVAFQVFQVVRVVELVHLQPMTLINFLLVERQLKDISFF
jgi:hypothetical protein